MMPATMFYVQLKPTQVTTKKEKITEEGIEMKEHKSTGVWLERKEREMEVPVTEAISQISDPTTEATKNDDFFKRGKTHRRQDKCVCVYLIFIVRPSNSVFFFVRVLAYGLGFVCSPSLRYFRGSARACDGCLFPFLSIHSPPLITPTLSYPRISFFLCLVWFGCQTLYTYSSRV